MYYLLALHLLQYLLIQIQLVIVSSCKLKWIYAAHDLNIWLVNVEIILNKINKGFIIFLSSS